MAKRWSLWNLRKEPKLGKSSDQFTMIFCQVIVTFTILLTSVLLLRLFDVSLFREVITFEGLPKPEPFAPNQVEKKKVWVACSEGMKTTSDRQAAWNGHVFMTSAGPCTTKTIASGVMR